MYIQFSSVTQSCPTLCDPMHCRMPGFPVHPQIPELTQTHVHQVDNAIQPFHPLSSLLLLPSVFPVSQFFASRSQSIGASASASVLPMNIQGLFPLGLTSLILLSKELSRVFSSTTVRKLQATKVIHINLLHFYTLTAKDQKEIFKKQFITASKRIKYLWIYLPKETKDL